MKPKIELLEVEDESCYQATDWTAVFSIAMVVAIITLFAWHIIF